MKSDPELWWPGKYDPDGRRTAVPRPGAVARVREQYGTEPPVHRLLLGDNLLALDALVREAPGSADLIYIDPPFATGGTFTVSTRIGEGADGRPPPEFDAPAYGDRWEGGVGTFLAMLDPRLRLIHELLAPHGSLYVHVDPTIGHAVKLMLDEVFGPGCFQREIVWRIGWVSGFKTAARNWIRNHDLIFFYVKNPRRFTFNKIYVDYPPGYRRRDGSPPRGRGMPIDDVWNANSAEFALQGAESLDSIQIKSFSTEKTGYATQKNESLLRRIITASSNPGDLVVDAFCGSGTTGVAAVRLGRRFIGCDSGRAAIHIARKRLLDLGAPGSLRVETLGGPRDADGGEHRRRVLAHHGARPLRGGRRIIGRAGKWGVAVTERDEVLTETTLTEIAGEAREHGLGSVEVLATALDVPLRRPSSVGGVRVVLRRVGKELDEPHLCVPAGAALRDVPEVRVDLDGLADGQVTVLLQAYGFEDPRRLPRAIREATRTEHDLVDAWAVAWDADATAPTFDAFAFRTHHRRSLPLRLGPHRYRGRGPFRLVVRIVDVMLQETDVVFELRRTHPQGPLCVEKARLR